MHSGRSQQPELMDLGPAHYSTEEYRECLCQLDRIGRFLGGDRATLNAFKSLKSPPGTILDVGCGGGLFTLRLAKYFPNAMITGLDISSEAISFAKESLSQANPPMRNVQFILSETPELNNPPNQFDVITSTLVCHHLSDEELISFLKKTCQIAKQAVIINDLHRHPLATFGFAALAPLFFRNRLICHDGLLSIRKAFAYQDWMNYLDAAGIDRNRCRVTWHWAFRWIVFIDTSTMDKNG